MIRVAIAVLAKNKQVKSKSSTKEFNKTHGKIIQLKSIGTRNSNWRVKDDQDTDTGIRDRYTRDKKMILKAHDEGKESTHIFKDEV